MHESKHFLPGQFVHSDCEHWSHCKASCLGRTLLPQSIHGYSLILQFESQIRVTLPGLTTLAKNRKTWLLPQRTWGRSEGMTGRNIFAKMWVFSLFFCIWSVSLLISCLYLSYLTLNSCFVFVLLSLLILYLLIFRFIHFCLEICQWHLNVRFLPPISYVPMIAVFKT